jgi:membrane protein
VFSAIAKAINRAWEVKEKPPFYVQMPKQLAEALSVTLLVGLSIGITTAVGVASNLPGPFGSDSGTGGAIMAEVISRGTTLLLSFIVFVLIYYFVPNTRTEFKGVLPGAVLAAILFEVGKAVFVFYISEFTSFSDTYGPLAGTVVLLVWLYYSGLILVLGAEFNVAWWAEKEEREGRPMPVPGRGAGRRVVPHG